MTRSSLLLVCVALVACNDPPPPQGSPAPPATAASASTVNSSAWQSLMVVRPTGWTVTQDPVENEHTGLLAMAPDGKCNVRLDLWAGLPKTPGGAMVDTSKRSVTVDGRKLDVIKTSQFQGVAAVVDAVFANDGTSYARAVFRDCSADQVDQALSTAKLAKSIRDQ